MKFKVYYKQYGDSSWISTDDIKAESWEEALKVAELQKLEYEELFRIELVEE